MTVGDLNHRHVGHRVHVKGHKVMIPTRIQHTATTTVLEWRPSPTREDRWELEGVELPSGTACAVSQ